MATRVLITVDTELGWRPYREGAGWEENLVRSFDPAGVGVPWQLQRLDEHGLKAVFFVDPMPALVYGIEPIRRMVEPILAAGQEVQLHLHPVWASVASGKPEGEKFELTCFDAAGQLDLVRTARDLLVEAGAPQPVAFRSGSYAVDAATLAALKALGLRYDSSHNGSYAPDPSALPLERDLIAPVAIDGIIELPVTQIEDSGGRLRHVQLCALSSDEIEACLLHAAREGHPAVVLVTHGFELASRDGKRANGALCGRFERLCAFLENHSETLPTAHFSGLGDLVIGAEARPLPASRLRRTRRLAEQAWSNALYERAL
ncbi:MAG TPA: polysaccharide deacetylase [Allosphingosinicella sp.]|nr:polysaccharide deacetylase [Allosphingosinicella sp.]